MPKLPCCGVIVLSRPSCQQGKLSTVLVTSRRGTLGFPKGKKLVDESDLDCAYRELKEETGILSDQIRLIDGVIAKEKKDKDNRMITYFVGWLKEDSQPVKFSWDPDELLGVNWYPINEIMDLELLKPARKEVFHQIVKQMDISCS